MVHETFDPSSIGYGDFIQEGGGLETQPNYFIGAAPWQRGYGMVQHGAGIGSVFKGLWRFFLPVLRRVGTTVSEEALSTGQRVMDRLKEGESLKSAISSEGKRGIDNVLDKGGLPKQFGTGRGIKRRGKNISLIGKPVIRKKRTKFDAFGLY